MAALRRRRPRTAPRARVVCLPHAGGAASAYLPWTDGLGEDVELAVAQYPGREDRLGETPHRAMGPLVAELAEEVDDLAARPEPLVLVGHSMGGAVAHELAQVLVARGHPPAHLVISGRQPPRHHRGGHLHAATDDDLLAELVRLDPANAETLAHRELMAVLLPTIRADYALIETYRPTPPVPVPCPVTVLRGAADPELGADETADWAELTTASCAIHVLPGDHFFVVTGRDAVTDLVRRLAFTAALPASIGTSEDR